MKRNILIIAAHPDDDILGCGGLIAKYRKSVNFKVIFIAEGSSCRYKNLSANKDQIDQTIKKRNCYAKNALKLLGVKNFSFYDLPCGRLDSLPIIEINKIIENEINLFKPEILFTHSESDNNNDHRIIFRSSLMAARPGVVKNLKTILSYEVLSSTEWNFSESFEPNHFELLNLNQINLKWKALKCYESETGVYPHPRSEEGIHALARYRGIQAGFKYAEAFKIIRNFKK
jgi:LmbE family N-acetylglucosaminyl deacetylase